MKSTHRRFNISIIGAGRVGSTLAVMLRRSGNTIAAVVSRNRRSAGKCGALVSCRNCSDNVSIIPSSSNLVIIAVPDQSIHSVAKSLGVLSHLNFNRMAVCHTSGAVTSDALEPVGRKGSRIFSLHPIQTFPGKKPLRDQIRSMKGITYGIEGPVDALATAKKLVRQLEGDMLVVPKEAKILYHLICVLASNYSVALVGAMESIASGFTVKGLRPFKKLIDTSIDNAIESGAGNALTGPIARGEGETVAAHLKSLKEPVLRALYKSLGAYALELATREHKLSPARIRQLRELLGT